MNVQSPDSPLTTLVAGAEEWMQMDVCVSKLVFSTYV